MAPGRGTCEDGDEVPVLPAQPRGVHLDAPGPAAKLERRGLARRAGGHPRPLRVDEYWSIVQRLSLLIVLTWPLELIAGDAGARLKLIMASDPRGNLKRLLVLIARGERLITW